MEPTAPVSTPTKTINTIPENMPAKKTQGKKYIIAGIVTVLVVVAAAGILYGVMVWRLSGIKNTSTPTTPAVTATLLPEMCTSAYKPLPDIAYRNTFNDLYYGQIVGNIQRVEKTSNNKINLFIKTLNALYLIPIDMSNQHNILYDAKTQVVAPVDQIPANQKANISFSCNIDKPETVSLTVTINKVDEKP